MEYESYIALALAFGAMILCLWTRFRTIWDAGTAVHPAQEIIEETEGEPLAAEVPKGPKCSVIAYAQSEEEEILEWLTMAMNQDYADYEVIIVNEGSYETSVNLAERLTKLYPERLYVTFIPSDARSLSRRKLANTVGLKAAKGEVVLTTATNCSIPSAHWISDIMRPFAEESGVDIVLGYTHMDFSELTGPWKWYRQMSATLTDCMWLGAAAQGRPFRGDGNNMAFRRSLFFDVKGYAKTIHLMHGDDDIFLRQIMDDNNTRLSLSSDSILVSHWGDSANRMLSEFKERYQFTSKFLPKWPFMLAGFSSIMQWVIVAAAVMCVAAGFLEPHWWISAASIGVLLLAFWITEILIYRRTARRLGSVCLWWSLPWFLLWHPIGNWIFRLRRFRHFRKNYTFT